MGAWLVMSAALCRPASPSSQTGLVPPPASPVCAVGPLRPTLRGRHSRGQPRPYPPNRARSGRSPPPLLPYRGGGPRWSVLRKGQGSSDGASAAGGGGGGRASSARPAWRAVAVRGVVFGRTSGASGLRRVGPHHPSDVVVSRGDQLRQREVFIRKLPNRCSPHAPKSYPRQSRRSPMYRTVASGAELPTTHRRFAPQFGRIGPNLAPSGKLGPGFSMTAKSEPHLAKLGPDLANIGPNWGQAWLELAELMRKTATSTRSQLTIVWD